MARKGEKYGWGVFLRRTHEWATLPPRLCKPTPHNCDLNPGLLEVARRHDAAGDHPEIKRIPTDQLKAMRADHK